MKLVFLRIVGVVGALLFLSSPAASLPKDWLQEFEKEFASSDYTSLYMMLSFSGYSNVGHIALMTNKKFSHGKVFVVEPNQNEISYVKEFIKKDIGSDVKKFAKWDKMGEFKYITFGGISYRFYHIEKKQDNKLEIVKYLSINNPNNYRDKPDSKDYIELKDFFFSKLKKFAIKENKKDSPESSEDTSTDQAK